VALSITSTTPMARHATSGPGRRRPARAAEALVGSPGREPEAAVATKLVRGHNDGLRDTMAARQNDCAAQ
jgi:hypothetical protein